MKDYAENPPLSKKEIEEARHYLHDALLPLSDPKKGRPYKEVFEEVRKNANF